MGAWGKAGGSDDVTMLADGNGDFAEALGLTMDGSGFGMGARGQRFSMIVNDGVVGSSTSRPPATLRSARPSTCSTSSETALRA